MTASEAPLFFFPEPPGLFKGTSGFHWILYLVTKRLGEPVQMIFSDLGSTLKLAGLMGRVAKCTVTVSEVTSFSREVNMLEVKEIL